MKHFEVKWAIPNPTEDAIVLNEDVTVFKGHSQGTSVKNTGIGEYLITYWDTSEYFLDPHNPTPEEVALMELELGKKVVVV